MPRFQHIFLDDGGVMNDNSLRPPQWQALVGEFFVPRLGGTAEGWAAANIEAFPPILEWMETQLARDGEPGWSYAEIQRAYDIRWLRGMAPIVGVGLDLSDGDCAALSGEALDFITQRVRAEAPGAVLAIRQLAEDYQLFTASMGSSRWLTGTLEAMGVADVFSRLYGPDLVNAAKHGPNFYTRIFADAGVDPAAAVVLDDKAEYLAKARAAGAFPILVSASADAGARLEGGAVIGSLAELPALLAGQAQ